MTGSQPSYIAYTFFCRKLGGLSQSFPSLGPGELIQASPYTARSNSHPCFCHRCGPLLCIGYFNWIFQLQKKRKKQKKTKNERGNEIVQELNIEDS